MGDMMEVLRFVVALTVAGVFAYAAVMGLSALRRRLERRSGPALPPEELDAIHARLEAAEALEHRVQELEERLDFAERMLAQQHESSALPGPRTDQH